MLEIKQKTTIIFLIKDTFSEDNWMPD